MTVLIDPEQSINGRDKETDLVSDTPIHTGDQDDTSRNVELGHLTTACLCRVEYAVEIYVKDLLSPVCFMK